VAINADSELRENYRVHGRFICFSAYSLKRMPYGHVIKCSSLQAEPHDLTV